MSTLLLIWAETWKASCLFFFPLFSVSLIPHIISPVSPVLASLAAPLNPLTVPCSSQDLSSTTPSANTVQFKLQDPSGYPVVWVAQHHGAQQYLFHVSPWGHIIPHLQPPWSRWAHVYLQCTVIGWFPDCCCCFCTAAMMLIIPFPSLGMPTSGQPWKWNCRICRLLFSCGRRWVKGLVEALLFL